MWGGAWGGLDARGTTSRSARCWRLGARGLWGRLFVCAGRTGPVGGEKSARGRRETAAGRHGFGAGVVPPNSAGPVLRRRSGLRCLARVNSTSASNTGPTTPAPKPRPPTAFPRPAWREGEEKEMKKRMRVVARLVGARVRRGCAKIAEHPSSFTFEGRRSARWRFQARDFRWRCHSWPRGAAALRHRLGAGWSER